MQISEHLVDELEATIGFGILHTLAEPEFEEFVLFNLNPHETSRYVDVSAHYSRVVMHLFGWLETVVNLEPGDAPQIVARYAALARGLEEARKAELGPLIEIAKARDNGDGASPDITQKIGKLIVGDVHALEIILPDTKTQA